MPANYAYAEVIEAEWVAVGSPSPNSIEISPYPVGAYDNGFVMPAPQTYQPPIGNPTPILDNVLDSQTYTTPTGQRAWLPTNYERELVDSVTQNPYQGLDELNAARAAAGADNAVLQNLPYVGDVVGGVVDGAMAYQRSGSVGVGVGTGLGSTAGGIAGSALGAALGAPLGPLGAVGGAIVGGALGSALGGALGGWLGGLIDPATANINGVLGEPPEGTPGPFTGGQCAGTFYLPTYTLRRREDGYTLPGSGPTLRGPVKGVAREGFSVGFTAANSDGSLGFQGAYGGSPGNTFDIINLTVSPRFGGADNCGDPDPEPTLYDPIADPIKPIPFRPTPGPLPQPRPIDYPVRRPDPITGPTPTPAPTLPNPTGYPGPVPDPNPNPDDKGKPGYKQPDPYPTGDKPNPNPTDPAPTPPVCDPCVELAVIRAKLEETFSLAWALPECDENFPINRTGENEGQGLAGLSQKIDGLYEILKVLHDNTRCNEDPFLVVPDSWPMKVESGRPQLVLIYADKKPDKTWGNRRYEFCIPHFDAKLRKALKSMVPKEIKKGSQQGTYTLADNSKIITYCATPTESMRIINLFDKLVLKEMRTTNKKTGQINPNTQFLKITLYPYQARYFSRGQHLLSPDWKDRLY